MATRRLAGILTLVGAVAVLAGAAPEIARAQGLDGRPIVYVANGSGSSTSLVDGLSTAVKHAGLPLAMKTVYWCRQPSAIKDHADHVNQLAAAQALAQEVLAIKSHSPGARIVFTGHSSGARVVLAAAERLPPRTIERIILFAASVNSYYDPRPAMSATTHGIDSFHSLNDGILDLIGETMGTADGKLTSAVGVTGFVLPYRAHDASSFHGLRQYPWSLAMQISGAHYSWTEPPFLYRTALPLLMTP